MGEEISENRRNQERPADLVLGRKIFIALAQRKFTTIEFPSLLDLKERRAYAIHGETNSGKSLLVQDASLSFLFRGQGVVYIDADYRFDVLNFLDKIKVICRSRDLPTAHFKSACRHMLVQKCGTSSELQLFVGFKLRQILRTSDAGLVVVDSLSSFYWHDRYSRARWKHFYDSIWLNLEKLKNEFGFILLVTIQDLFSEERIRQNFLHCSQVDVKTIRTRFVGQNHLHVQSVENGSSISCGMKDGILRKLENT